MKAGFFIARTLAVGLAITAGVPSSADATAMLTSVAGLGGIYANGMTVVRWTHRHHGVVAPAARHYYGPYPYGAPFPYNEPLYDFGASPPYYPYGYHGIPRDPGRW